MINILYIYGFNGSPNGRSATFLKRAFADSKKYKVYSVEYPQSDPYEVLPFLNNVIKELNINFVVGTSLGAYWALQLKGINKLLINICLHPEVELEKLVNPSASKEVVDAYKSYIDETPIFTAHTETEAYLTSCLFGQDDELLGDKYIGEMLGECRLLRIEPEELHSLSEKCYRTTVYEMIKILS